MSQSLKNLKQHKNKYNFHNTLLTKKKNNIFHKVYYYLLQFPLLYKYRDALKYYILGITGTIADFVLLFLGVKILGEAKYWIIAIFSSFAGIIVNYYLNKKFTFKFENRKLKARAISFVKYASVTMFSNIGTYVLMILLCELLNMHYMLSKLIASIVFLFVRFVSHKIFFNKKKEEAMFNI
ncbi:MAG: GtrA family protein [archaeon]